MNPLLQIKNLSVSFSNVLAVDDVNISIPTGKLVALVGESGSGKSLTALSILRLLPGIASAKGEIIFSAEGSPSVNLLNQPQKLLEQIRGNKIAMIFQEPMTSLNPVQTCGAQVMESLQKHLFLKKAVAKKEAIKLFRQVLIPNPEAAVSLYPHELSGGQKQRVMIAMAISCNPALLIADEPTTALDASVQKSIVALLKDLQKTMGLSILFITHDLNLVADTADEILVMYKGQVVEQGLAKNILVNPTHPYTKALLACSPTPAQRGKKLPVINQLLADAAITKPTILKEAVEHGPSHAVVSVRNLNVAYRRNRNLFGLGKSPKISAVNNVSFDVVNNEILGLVGESGCGKTSLGRAMMQLIPYEGEVTINGQNLSNLKVNALMKARRAFQTVFQDPYSSLNPRMSIGQAIAEPMKVHRIQQKDITEKVIHLLEKVGLSADQYKRYPHQFSGGQRQRICIARALALNPSFIIFDESVSALDVSVQAQILNLINELKNDLNFSALFIAHDLRVVHYISNRIMVMQNGSIVETGEANEVFFNAKHPYTKQLLSAMAGASIKF